MKYKIHKKRVEIKSEEIKNSKWMSPCCGNTPILKSSIFNEEQLNTCPNCDKHYPYPPRQRFDHFYGKNKWELIDTPNPNAKKIETDIDDEKALLELENIIGIASVFVGPGFITITKDQNIGWDIITQDIVDIFDKL